MSFTFKLDVDTKKLAEIQKDIKLLNQKLNDYQNKETVFDLKLGFWEEAPVPSPTPTNSSGNATSIVTIINRVIQINTGGGTSTSTINNIILNIKNIFRFSL